MSILPSNACRGRRRVALVSILLAMTAPFSVVFGKADEPISAKTQPPAGQNPTAATPEDLVKNEDILARQAVKQAWVAWRKAGYPDSDSPLAQNLHRAAVHAGRMDLVEQLLAGGPTLRKMLPLPRETQVVPLHVLRTFRSFRANLDEEMFASFQGESGWLARRITADRVEVWTSSHGWLFDGSGHLLHEARPERRSGTGERGDTRDWAFSR